MHMYYIERSVNYIHCYKAYSADTMLLAGLLIVLVFVVTKAHAAICVVSNQTMPY